MLAYQSLFINSGGLVYLGLTFIFQCDRVHMSDDTTYLFFTRTSKEAQDVLWLLSVTNFPKLNHKIQFQRYSLGSFYNHHKLIIFFLSQMKNVYLVF